MERSLRLSNVLVVLGLGLVLPAAPVLADDERWEVGARGILVTAGGEPANDMIGVGVYGEYRLEGGSWYVGAAVDSYSYDFERPWQIVGIEQDPSVDVIDAPTDALVFSGWIGREYRPDRGLRFFWTAGLGFGSPDVDDVTGPVEGGGTFTITTDPGSEIILGVTGGLRQLLGQRWSLQFALRADHHFADWEVVDSVSGNAGSIDDYTGLGAHLAIGFRF